jgi:hypothetical protein
MEHTWFLLKENIHNGYPELANMKGKAAAQMLINVAHEA